MIRNIYTYLRFIFRLSLQIAKAEFKLKNEGSYLGVFWYLLNPVLTFGLLFYIFSDRLGNSIQYYSLYLLIGIILFNLFQSATIESSKALVYNHLIKSINFPREAIIISVILKSLFSHFFEILLFCCVLIFMHFNLFWVLFYIPILIIFLVFIFGVSLILAYLTIFFIDLDNIWNFLVRLIWLGTPIFYAISGQTRLFYLNLFNPIYYFITTTRAVIIYHTMPEAWILLGMFGFSALSLLIGISLFKILNKKITELV